MVYSYGIQSGQRMAGARYNKSYKITDHELNTFSKRVQEVKAISDRVCRERIEELRKIVSEG